MENTYIIGFAGSRHGSVPEAQSLVSALASQGASFLVGCAPGVDRSFRKALVGYVACTTVHCAFPSRVRNVEQAGLYAVCKTGNAPSPAAALHQRTVGMVADCTHLVIFPDNPTTGAWGRGSRLAFRTAVQLHKRVFVVTAIPPLANRHTRVSQASLFGVVQGYLVEPVASELLHVA